MAIPRNLANLANQLDTSGNPPKVQVGDSSVVVTDTGSNGTVTITTDGATAVTVDSGQRTKFPTTIGVGNATPSTSGAGITFPATQSASSNANTLDDYEQGTFTPTIIGTSTAGTGTYSLQLGRYTKIGNRVLVCGVISWSAHTGSGSMDIGGFPFTSVNVTDLDQYFFSIFSNINYTKSQIYVGLPPNTTKAICGEIDANQGGTNMPLDTAGYIGFTGQYEVAD